jgi:hypothetical protein
MVPEEEPPAAVLGERGLSPALDAVEAGLLEAGTPLFQMNGALVEMIRFG